MHPATKSVLCFIIEEQLHFMILIEDLFIPEVIF